MPRLNAAATFAKACPARSTKSTGPRQDLKPMTVPATTIKTIPTHIVVLAQAFWGWTGVLGGASSAIALIYPASVEISTLKSFRSKTGTPRQAAQAGARLGGGQLCNRAVPVLRAAFRVGDRHQRCQPAVHHGLRGLLPAF